jgi:hypothetical protein
MAADKVFIPPHRQDVYENDPGEVRKFSPDEFYGSLARQGVPLEALRDLDERKAYEDWLKANPLAPSK